MTRAFDEAARSKVGLFDVGLSGSEKPRDLRVEQVSPGFARPYIASGHYSRTMPDSTREAFAGFYGDVCAGIVAFGMGANHAAFTALVPDVRLGEYRELTRLWVHEDAPRNTASRLVSGALAQLPSEVRLVLSFADTGQGHAGYVYQALNFQYCGVSRASAGMTDENGHAVHPRLLGIYRMRHPEEYGGLSADDLMRTLGWSKSPGSDKHRYALARGPKAYSVRRRWPSLPYPKLAGGVMETTPADQPGSVGSVPTPRSTPGVRPMQANAPATLGGPTHHANLVSVGVSVTSVVEMNADGVTPGQPDTAQDADLSPDLNAVPGEEPLPVAVGDPLGEGPVRRRGSAVRTDVLVHGPNASTRKGGSV